MYRFWDHVIRPCFAALQPRIIVEIGADQGRMTKHLHTYVKQQNGKLYVIDPVLSEPLSQLVNDPNITYYQDSSLNTLSQIPYADIVLIDGDHNWYTVINELRMIAKTMRPFPVVLLHDVDWPYGRRDMYHNIHVIAPEDRQPYAQIGINLESHTLSPDGINPEYCHAIQENTPRNGVKTAVEDFLRETSVTLQYAELKGLHGLGMIYGVENSAMHEFVSSLSQASNIEKHVITLEQERLTKEQRNRQSAEKIRQLEMRLTIAKSALDAKDASLKNAAQREHILKEKMLLYRKHMVTTEEQMQQLLRTRSWKLTEPLRKVQHKLSKLLRP